MLKIVIGPRYECAEALTTHKATYIFSIQESCEKGLEVQIAEGEPGRLMTPEGIVKHHHFFFDDVDHHEPVPVKYIGTDKFVYCYPPTKEDIKEILELAKELPDDARLYLHCFAGISRSSACAFAIYCQALGPGKETEAIGLMHNSAPYGGLSPNQRIVQLADELLDRNGRMIEAMAKYKKKGKSYEEWQETNDWLRSLY